MEANEFFSKGAGVVTLCGSTKFFSEAMEANRLLTFDNWVVLACGSWGHSYHKYATNLDKNYDMLKRLHYYKIKMSDAIVVVSDESGYRGYSTNLEMKYAETQGIPVFWFDGSVLSGQTHKDPPNRELDSQIEKLLT